MDAPYSIVENLHHRLKRLECSGRTYPIKAPVPEGRSYTRQEQEGFDGNADSTERRFQNQFKQDAEIPADYLDRFETMLREIIEWAGTSMNRDRRSYKDFQCPICYMDFVVNPGIKQLEKKIVVIRPCAEKRGFYKLIMWAMRHCVLRNGFDRIVMKNVFDTNKSILTSMGFKTEIDEIWEYENCFMTNEELSRVTPERWRLTDLLEEGKTPENEKFFKHDLFPEHHALNSQAAVDEHFRGRAA